MSGAQRVDDLIQRIWAVIPGSHDETSIVDVVADLVKQLTAISTERDRWKASSDSAHEDLHAKHQALREAEAELSTVREATISAIAQRDNDWMRLSRQYDELLHEKRKAEKERDALREENRRLKFKPNGGCSHCGEYHAEHVACRSDWTGVDKHGR